MFLKKNLWIATFVIAVGAASYPAVFAQETSDEQSTVKGSDDALELPTLVKPTRKDLRKEKKQYKSAFDQEEKAWNDAKAAYKAKMVEYWVATDQIAILKAKKEELQKTKTDFEVKIGKDNPNAARNETDQANKDMVERYKALNKQNDEAIKKVDEQITKAEGKQKANDKDAARTELNKQAEAAFKNYKSSYNQDEKVVGSWKKEVTGGRASETVMAKLSNEAGSEAEDRIKTANPDTSKFYRDHSPSRSIASAKTPTNSVTTTITSSTTTTTSNTTTTTSNTTTTTSNTTTTTSNTTTNTSSTVTNTNTYTCTDKDAAIKALVETTLRDKKNTKLFSQLFDLAAAKMRDRLDNATKPSGKKGYLTTEGFLNANPDLRDKEKVEGFVSTMTSLYSTLGMKDRDLNQIAIFKADKNPFSYKTGGKSLSQRTSLRLDNDSASAMVLLLAMKDAAKDSTVPDYAKFTEGDAAMVAAMGSLRMAKESTDTSYKIGEENGNLMDFSSRVLYKHYHPKADDIATTQKELEATVNDSLTKLSLEQQKCLIVRKDNFECKNSNDLLAVKDQDDIKKIINQLQKSIATDAFKTDTYNVEVKTGRAPASEYNYGEIWVSFKNKNAPAAQTPTGSTGSSGTTGSGNSQAPVTPPASSIDLSGDSPD